MDAFGKAIFAIVLAVAVAVMVIEAGRFISETANRNAHPSQEGCPKTDVTPTP